METRLMQSKVSGFLRETMAQEIQDGFTAPVLLRSFETALPLIQAINKAHLLMLVQQDILELSAAREIAAAIVAFDREGAGAFHLDPALEEGYFVYEAELVRRIGANVGGRLHTARSRNDLKATLDRMRARAKMLLLVSNLIELRQALLVQARRYNAVVAPGYTHMQPAQPITFGWYLLGVENALARDCERLAQCYARINLCPLGAGAMAGTSFPIDRGMTARLLGFADIIPHAQDAVASRDALIELVSASTLLMSTVGKLAHDFYTMTMYEVGTLDLPDSVAITSSIMPQKKNMAALEQLKGRTPILAGALFTAISAQKGVPFSHVQDAGLDALRWVWDALDEAVYALPIARVIVERAQPREERMLSLVRENFSTATDLADMLVRDAGLSFREAHHVVGRAVRLAIERGLNSDEINDALLDQAADETIGRRLAHDPARLPDALDPRRAVDSRGASGGPGAEATLAGVGRAETRLADEGKAHDRCVAAVATAEKALSDAFALLLDTPENARVDS